MNGPAIESGNANETSRLDRGSSRQSKSQTITDSIKRMFKAAAKAFSARDDEQPPTSSKRKRGETDGMPIRLQIAKDYAGKIAARSRYAALKPVRRGAARLRRAFSASAEDTGLPEIADTPDYANGSTLDWLNLWWNDGAEYGADHGLDSQFSAQQDRNFPQL